MTGGLILLDRDGVINSMVVDAEHGTIDSPLHPSQVRLIASVPAALRQLGDAGYRLAVVSNQPAAAKGKTTQANLEAVHDEILRQAQAAGAVIASSHLCFHRSEDGCACRKPRTGLLEAAFTLAVQADGAVTKDRTWMVGDGITDIQAGEAFGVRTAFISAKKSDLARVLFDARVQPTAWHANLAEFTRFLTTNGDLAS